jgi:hypothetical protein
MTVDQALRAVHIAMGSVGLVAGALAMSLGKGSRAHARSGVVFSASMLLMAATGVLLATVITPNRGNAMGGLLTLYLVLTAWATVWRSPGESGGLEKAACLLGIAVAVTGITWGSMAAAATSHRLDGYPPTLFFVFATVVSAASLADVRLIRNGGIRGTARTTRHLWRMCAAMFIATSSFFLGLASRRFPAFVKQSHLNIVPVVLVIIALVYFLVRVRIAPAWRRRHRAIVAQERA